MSNSILSFTLKIIFVFYPINAVTNFHKNGEKYLKRPVENRPIEIFEVLYWSKKAMSEVATLYSKMNAKFTQ